MIYLSSILSRSGPNWSLEQGRFKAGPVDCRTNARKKGEDRRSLTLPFPLRSDIHFWHAGKIGPMVVENDHILGHESAGMTLYPSPLLSLIQPPNL